MAPCTTTYDKASNVIAINTPATQSFGGSITMSYSYNRLVKKYMPNSSGTDLYDVDYIYGSYNDGRNGVGRIVSITQGGGFKSDSYRYDELGQRVEEDITVDVPMYGYRDFNTKKYFDSFGRILQAVYPDGDQVDYDYNSLGELNTIKSKVAGVTQDIVSAISYNGYGQISQLTYGNGTTTSYSYATGNTNKATTLMGSTVNAKEQGASAFTPVLSRTYTYNKQGMVAQMNRNVAGSLLSQVGNASFTDAYTYDRFGRLGAHAQSKGGTSIYSLDMQYNQAGGITFKTSNGSGFMNASALNYDLLYSYSGNYGHQLERIDDPVNASTTYFTYNASGSITQIDDPSQAIAQNFFWNEQQQLTGVSNQQGVHHYVYDHSGERIMKSSLINSTVYLNDQVIDNVSNLEPYTVYVNPYYVVTGLMGGDRVSKHYYMNQQRVATDITINYDPNGGGGGQQEQLSAKDPASAAPELSPALANFSEVLSGLGQKPLDTASLKLPTIASYYPEAAKTPATSSNAEGNPSAPRILFWYHPDYLGNVDLITERDGYTHEFFMYNPWGEEMHQWNANTYAFTSPYRFNAKELDPETGLAYYGARYYQNKLGVWLSVDPKFQETLMTFEFSANNPLKFIDEDGAKPIVPDEPKDPNNQINWELVKKGTWNCFTSGMTIVGSVITMAATEGASLPLSGTMLSLGITTFGLGAGQVAIGLQGGAQEIPSGVFEALDEGIGGAGETGQILDLASSGVPKNVVEVAATAIDIANLDALKTRPNNDSKVKVNQNAQVFREPANAKVLTNPFAAAQDATFIGVKVMKFDEN
jgi:RHS repeat-associated protein